MQEDKRLIYRLKKGDNEALRIVYEKYKGDMMAIAASILQNDSEAEDVLHDVFVSFAGAVGGFELYGSLRNYLVTCVINRIRNQFRKRKERRGGEQSDEIHSFSEEPGRLLILDEESRLINDALSRLPVEQREAVVLHLKGNMKFREIAANQGVSISTVQGRYRYGLEKLRLVLNGELRR